MKSKQFLLLLKRKKTDWVAEDNLMSIHNFFLRDWLVGVINPFLVPAKGTLAQHETALNGNSCKIFEQVCLFT